MTKISVLEDLCESTQGDLEIRIHTPIGSDSKIVITNTFFLARATVSEFIKRLGVAVSGTLEPDRPHSDDCPFCFTEYPPCDNCETNEELADDWRIKADNLDSEVRHLDLYVVYLQNQLESNKIDYESESAYKEKRKEGLLK